MFPLVVCMHHVMWNQIHMEMHKPEGRFFAHWPFYKLLARHHYLHHRYPDKNFNVALPVGDILFGTMAKPTEEDWQAMRLEGIA
jgi:sterol desaturase/sphingolipid hydroxylase (fatty acid hydroxylase superfamily)